MKIYRPLWNEGVMLSAQQFQQQSDWEAFTNLGLSKLASPFPWGVENIELDESLLLSGRIQARHLRLWLPDGALIDTLISDLPPAARELNPGSMARSESVVLLLALPLMQHGIINRQTEAAAAERPLRYREEWVSVQDVFGPEEESMAVARFNLSFRFDYEENASWQCCPIARLLTDGRGGWRLDPQFIPPLALFSASQYLRGRLALLNRQLSSRRQRLMSMRRESNERLADFAVADVSLFWLLNALNSYGRTLAHHERFPARHPEHVWLELARLAGSMLTFSLEHDLDAIPAYDHASPETSFPPLFDLITGLLEASLPSRVIALDMSRPDKQTWKASVRDMRLREEADFYLSVRSDMPSWQVAERFPALCKAGAPQRVNEISSAALNGIPLIALSRIPAALPVRLENHYFALDMGSDAAREMLDQGVCVFYVPSLLGDLHLELFAVLRP